MAKKSATFDESLGLMPVSFSSIYLQNITFIFCNNDYFLQI